MAATRRGFLDRMLKAGAAMALGSPLIATRARKESSMTAHGDAGKWAVHRVGKIPAGYQVAVADVDGDGKPDILALSSEKSVIKWFENGSWESHPITLGTPKNISLAPLEWNGYKGHGVALATDFYLNDSTRGGTLWWAEPAKSRESEWNLSPIATIPTSHRLRWGDLDGDGRPELIDVPLLGSGAKAPDYNVGAPITYFRVPDAIWYGGGNSSGSKVVWERHLIDDSSTVVHGVRVLDWDADGREEILVASFEGVQGQKLKWEREHLCAGDQTSGEKRGSSEIDVGVLAGRRFLATIEPWHGDKVVVYFESKRGELWTRHVIDASFNDGHALACADFDGDGNSELSRTRNDLVPLPRTGRVRQEMGTPGFGHGYGGSGSRIGGHQWRWPLGHCCHRGLHRKCDMVRKPGITASNTGPYGV